MKNTRVRRSFRRSLAAGFGAFVLTSPLLLGGVVERPAYAHGIKEPPPAFQRIASFPVFQNTDVELETVAEIVTSSSDGNTLIYKDSETANIGFVDITDPANPGAAGVVSVAGEPTSVAVAGDCALAAVNTSVDFVNPSGVLQVIDINTRTVVQNIALGGQP